MDSKTIDTLWTAKSAWRKRGKIIYTQKADGKKKDFAAPSLDNELDLLPSVGWHSSWESEWNVN